MIFCRDIWGEILNFLDIMERIKMTSINKIVNDVIYDLKLIKNMYNISEKYRSRLTTKILKQRKFRDLETLSLYDNNQVGNINFLKNLKVLDSSHRNINPKHISQLYNLEYLDLSRTTMKDNFLFYLRRLKKLVMLKANFVEIDLNFLENDRLEGIDLSFSIVKNQECINKLINLKYIFANFGRVRFPNKKLLDNEYLSLLSKSYQTIMGNCPIYNKKLGLCVNILNNNIKSNLELLSATFIDYDIDLRDMNNLEILILENKRFLFYEPIDIYSFCKLKYLDISGIFGFIKEIILENNKITIL